MCLAQIRSFHFDRISHNWKSLMVKSQGIHMRRVDVPNKKVLETACASISIELHLEWRSRVGFGGDGEAVETDRRLDDKDSSK